MGAAAIAKAGALLGPGPAVVLTVREPVRVWEPWDPVTILSAPLERLAAKEIDLDQIVADLARDKAESGVVLARAAGFDATARIARGKTWKAICEAAEELDADPIVIGSRGLGRAQSALLGSVSSARREALRVGHDALGSGQRTQSWSSSTPWTGLYW